MSVLSDAEGNQSQLGGANANSTPSGEQGQPSLEEQLAALNTNLGNALKKLDAQDGEIRALKSGKDKAVDRAVGELQPLKETVAKIAKHLNISETDVIKAQRELALDELVQERLNGGVQPKQEAQGSAERKGNAVELQIVDDLLELPVNDSRVTQLKLDYGHDTNAYKEKAKELSKQLAGGAPVTPAEQPTPPGKAPQPAGVAQQTNNYIQDMRNARGKGNAFGDAIKDKYRKLGVDVDNISFAV